MVRARRADTAERVNIWRAFAELWVCGSSCTIPGPSRWKKRPGRIMVVVMHIAPACSSACTTGAHLCICRPIGGHRYRHHRHLHALEELVARRCCCHPRVFRRTGDSLPRACLCI